jgi:hypothetical protein
LWRGPVGSGGAAGLLVGDGRAVVVVDIEQPPVGLIIRQRILRLLSFAFDNPILKTDLGHRQWQA